MAQARSQTKGGMTSVHVWMIGFAFLWLVSTVLLVLLYTDQATIKAQNDELRTDYARVIGPADKSLPYFSQAGQGGRTMVGLLEEARQQTAKLALGEEAADVATVRARVEELLNQILGDGLVQDRAPFETMALLPALEGLYQGYRTEYEMRVAAQDRAAEAENQLEDLIATTQQHRNEFDQAADRLKEQIDQLEKERGDYAAQRDNEVDTFQARFDERQQEYARDIQEQRQNLQREQERLRELQNRYAQLQAKLGELQIGPGVLSTARQADGRIIAAKPGDDVVYIDLGRQNQLTAGLQFAVYPAEVGIPEEGTAKARIEVVRIHETTSECKIVALGEMAVIIEGDIIANPIYDRNRKLVFMVVGDFDLDGNGLPDPDGADQIKTLIGTWGGLLADTVSSRVDFVVAGYAPEAPPPSLASKTTREAGERVRLIQGRIQEFNSVLASAAQLSIPLLPQEVFLRFLGY